MLEGHFERARMVMSGGGERGVIDRSIGGEFGGGGVNCLVF